MPLIKSKSKKAFEKNVEAEMHTGKPQDQSLAIAYNIKRKAKKKMANGGMAYKNESARTEQRPMPSETDNDSKNVSQNSGNKSPVNDRVTDTPERKQSMKGPQTTRIKHPKMVPTDAFSIRLRDEEDDLQSSASVNNGPQRQPPEHDNEEGPNRQGPKVSDMQDEHSTHRKPYAKGGEVEASDYSARPNKHMDDLLDLPPSEDEGEANARSRNEIDADKQNSNPLDMEREHSNGRKPYASGGTVESGSSTMNYADGGSIDEEEAIEHAASIAAAIMAKRKKMALGGEILEDGDDIHSHGSMDSDDSSQVDLSRNADEDANEEDQASFDALRKENYSETAGLDALDQPKDSNLTGDDREEASENTNSRSISDAIRRKMRARSAITR